MRLILHEDFIKEVKKLPKEIRERVKEKLILVENKGFSELQKLSGFDLYKIRIGKYRILFIVDFQKSNLYPMSIYLRKISTKI